MPYLALNLELTYSPSSNGLWCILNSCSVSGVRSKLHIQSVVFELAWLLEVVRKSVECLKTI